MRPIKIKTFFLFLMLVISTFFIMLPHTQAGIDPNDNNWYIEDFEKYAEDEVYFSDSVSGDVWFNATPYGGYNGAECTEISGNNWLAWSRTGAVTGVRRTNISLFQQTTKINMTNYMGQISNNPQWDWNWLFYDFNGNLIFRVLFEDTSASSTQIYMIIYDSDGTTILEGSHDVSGGSGYFDIEYNATTGLYLIDYAGSSNDGKWYSITNDNYIGLIDIHLDTATHGIQIDNFRIETATETPRPWEGQVASYNSKGHVDNNGDTVGYGVGTYLGHEMNYNELFYSTIRIRQVALAIGSANIIGDWNLQLWINDHPVGDYDSYYYYSGATDDRYVIVWEDMDLNITEEIVFEWKIIEVNPTTAFHTINYIGDVDTDGDINHKYAGDNVDTYLNGVYDMPLGNSNYEYAYEFWYESDVEYEGEPNFQEGNLSRCFVSKGNWDTLSTLWPAGVDRYLEFDWETSLTMNITAVALYVTDLQHDMVSDDLDDYTLFMNGDDKNQPDLWIDDVDGYRLVWTSVNRIYRDEQPRLEFECTALDSSTYWPWRYAWQIYVTSGGTDNIPEYHKHSEFSLYGNNQLDGNTVENAPSVCFYYRNLDYEPETALNDTIYVQTEDKTFKQMSSVPFFYTLNRRVPSNYIQIWDNHTGTPTQYTTRDGWGGFGKLIPPDKWYGHASFYTGFPTEGLYGNFDVCLVRNNVNVSKDTFTIVNLTTEELNGWLTTDPNPSELLETFEVHWLYNSSYWGNLNGGIAYKYNTPDFSEHKKWLSNIAPSGTRPFDPASFEGVIYFWLCSIRADGTWESIFSHPHYVGVSFIDEVYVRHNPIYLDDYPSGIATQYIYGTHSHFGDDVYVTLNGQRIPPSLRTQPIFEFPKKIYSAGNYYVELCYNDPLDGRKVVLDNTSFDVHAQEHIPSALPDIEDERLKIIGGLIVVIFITMIPFFFIIRAKFEKSLHPMVYVFFGLLGIGVAVGLGFFAIWLLLFVLAGLLIFGMMFYFLKGRGGEA